MFTAGFDELPSSIGSASIKYCIEIRSSLGACSSNFLNIHRITNASDNKSHCSERSSLNIGDGGMVSMRVLPSETLTTTSLWSRADGSGCRDSMVTLGTAWLITALMASSEGGRFMGLTGDEDSSRGTWDVW